LREDGTIPKVMPKHWLLNNTFRTNAQIDGLNDCGPPFDPVAADRQPKRLREEIPPRRSRRTAFTACRLSLLEHHLLSATQHRP
jgi:hypothetical protein